MLHGRVDQENMSFGAGLGKSASRGSRLGARKALKIINENDVAKTKKVGAVSGAKGARRAFGTKLTNTVNTNRHRSDVVGGIKKLAANSFSKDKKLQARRQKLAPAKALPVADVEHAATNAKVKEAEIENMYNGGVNLAAALGALQMGSRPSFENTLGEEEFTDMISCGVDRGFDGWDADEGSDAFDGVEVSSKSLFHSNAQSNVGMYNSTTSGIVGSLHKVESNASKKLSDNLGDLSFDDLSSDDDDDDDEDEDE